MCETETAVLLPLLPSPANDSTHSFHAPLLAAEVDGLEGPGVFLIEFDTRDGTPTISNSFTGDNIHVCLPAVLLALLRRSLTAVLSHPFPKTPNPLFLPLSPHNTGLWRDHGRSRPRGCLWYRHRRSHVWRLKGWCLFFCSLWWVACLLVPMQWLARGESTGRTGGPTHPNPPPPPRHRPSIHPLQLSHA